MINFPKIVLGTAQFGMDYGITNSEGKVKDKEISNILKLAESKGINYLDTAPAYGDAENIIGKHLLKYKTFNIISKLPKQKNFFFEEKDIKRWDQTISKSYII